LALGAAYFESYDLERAKQELAPLTQNPPTATGAYYYLGPVANRLGDYSDAQQQLKRALKANPTFVDAYSEIGLVYLKQKKYQDAENALQNALALDPDSYTANLNLMIVYQRTNGPRAELQAQRFEDVKNLRNKRWRDSLRTIEVRP